MANSILSKLVSILIWVTGVLVSLAVGFGMTKGGALNQSIPGLSGLANGLVVSIAGWVVVVLTILGIILAILDR